jgi:hypothetical protein
MKPKVADIPKVEVRPLIENVKKENSSRLLELFDDIVKEE